MPLARAIRGLRGRWPGRLAALAAGALFALAVLEGGLRLAGRAWESGRSARWEPDADADYALERHGGRREPRLVLALGDSLTNGANVAAEETYPYRLYRLLAARGRPAAVYNLGYCEESTGAALRRLRDYLADRGARNPDAVVLLAGAADLFHRPMARRDARAEAFWGGAASRCGRWRTCKLLRQLRLSLSARRLSGRPGAGSEEAFARALESYRRMSGRPGPPALSPSELAGLEPLVRARLAPYGMRLDAPEDFLELLADLAGEAYSSRGRYDELFGLLLDMAERYPALFWRGFYDIAGYRFVQSYRLQSRYGAEEVLATLERGAAGLPELEGNEAFAFVRELLRGRERVEREVAAERRAALAELARLCRARGIRLVLQSYPVTYRDANAALAAAAAEHGLPFVDNAARFAPALAARGRAELLTDDDHLTPEGYALMAEGVAGALP